MQLLTEPPRDGFTSSQVMTLIRDEPVIGRDIGLELLDMNLNVIEDISSDFKDGSVSRNSYATLHGNADIQISRELDWGVAIVRPYIKLVGDIEARFNLGAYFTNAPNKVVGEIPVTYEVECYDLLHALDTPTGDTYSVQTGRSYLEVIAEILTGQGFTKFIIDQTAASLTVPNTRIWPIGDNVTWLGIVNDLLNAVGYQGIWSDWNGYLRCEKYIRPIERASEFVYDRGIYTTMLGARVVNFDFFFAPNRWVAVRNNDVDGPTPVEGNGMYTYTNEFDGPTSVQARGNRVITRLLSIDAADQQTLEERAQISIDADTRIVTKYQIETGLNPLHWHFDRITLDDPEIGPSIELISTSWTLPLRGYSMAHEWRTV
jgi:hypothetical protein